MIHIPFSSKIMSLLRIDRLLSLYIALPYLVISKSKNKLHIPILMYHSICNNREKRSHPYYQINTSPVIFEQHMSFLYENNFKVINLEQVRDFLQKLHATSNSKSVVITFDDGFKDFYTTAFPILKSFDFSATVFLATDFVGRRFLDKSCLDWEEIKELREEGIQFGSHTVTHPKLVNLDDHKIEYELRKSKEIIENNVDQTVFAFAYPYAFPEHNNCFIQRLKKILLQSGYKLALTTSIGTVDKISSLFINRIPVNNYDDIALFEAKLHGAYNWMGYFQRVYKAIRFYSRLNE